MYLHDIVQAIDCPAINCPGSYNSVSSLIYILGEAGTVQCRRGAYVHIEVKLFVLGALAKLEHIALTLIIRLQPRHLYCPEKLDDLPMAQSQLLQEALVKTLGVIRKYRAHPKCMQIHLCSVILQSSHRNCLICIPEVRYVLYGC